MGGKSTPKAPDLTSLSNAQIQISNDQLAQAQQQMNLSQSQFNQYMGLSQQELQQSQDQYNTQMGLQQKALDQADAANAVSKSVADQQIAQSQQAMDYAKQEQDRYTNTILPLQDQYIQAAQAYSSPEQQAAAAGQALADNQTQLEAQRNNQMAQLTSMGIDPSQVMSSSLSSQLGVAGAAQGALNANTARQNTIQTGYGMLANAISMGQNLPSQATANLGAATGSANSAAGNINSSTSNYNSASGIGQTGSGIAQNAINLSSQITGSPMSWASLGNQSYGGASNGIMNASSIINQGFQNQMSAQAMKNQESQSTMSTIGSIAGMAGMAMMAEGGVAGQDGWGDQPIDYGSGAMGGNVSAPSSSITASDLPQTISGPTSADVSTPWLTDQKRQQLGMGLRMAASMNQPAQTFSDPNMQHQWLQPVHRAEGGAMGSMPTQAAGIAALTGQPGNQPTRVMPSMQARDKIHTMLAPGEYVVPADVVRQLGIQHFDKLVNKYHRPGA